MQYLFWSGVAFVSFLWWYVRPLRKRTDFDGKHCFISGGSQGIGRALAIELARQGASITIASRNKDKLAETKRLIEAAMRDAKRQRVCAVSVDVCEFTDVQAAATASVNALGLPSFVFCAAGASEPGYFVEQTIEHHQRAMNLDYFGTLHVVKAFVDLKVKSIHADEWRALPMHFVLFSSVLGLMGFVGFGTYAGPKFAVRGLAETLRNELLPHHIGVSIVYPPDTNTPGYQSEMLTKPPECAEISRMGGSPLPPNDVARAVLRDVSEGEFHVAVDLGTKMIVSACAGVTPRRSKLMDALLLPVLVGAGYVFQRILDSVVVRGFKRRLRMKRHR